MRYEDNSSAPQESHVILNAMYSTTDRLFASCLNVGTQTVCYYVLLKRSKHVAQHLCIIRIQTNVDKVVSTLSLLC
jgi:hypothetical protein